MRISCLIFISLFFLIACEENLEEFYPDGTLKSTVPLVDDKKNGLEKTFYKNASIKSEIYFKEGLKEGAATEYYPDGSIKATYTYKSNFIEGEVLRFHTNGKLAYKAKHSKNIAIEFPLEFDDNEIPLREGVFIDPRDLQKYEWVRIDSTIWLTQNLNYAIQEESLCLQCNHWGRLYNLNAIEKACPTGFRIPNKEDWTRLIKKLGEHPSQKLKAESGWDPIGNTGLYGNGNNSSKMNIQAAGAHFANSNIDIKNRNFKDAGQKSYLWTQEAEVMVLYYNKQSIDFIKWNPEYGASLRCIY